MNAKGHNEPHSNSSPFRYFLAQLELAKLRQGVGQWRLGGNGLVVPHRHYSDSREWEDEEES